jgi:hypothetical protein
MRSIYRSSRRLRLLALALCALAMPPWGIRAEGLDQAAATSLLAAVDSQKRFADSDFSYDLELATQRDGKPTKLSLLRVFRRDSKLMSVALVLSPESEKGEGYLRLGDNLWFFDSDTGAYVHRVLSDAVSDSEMESGDLEPDSYLGCYSVSSIEEGRLGGVSARVLDLRERGVQAYPRVKVWARTGDGLLLKEEFYGASGRLIRYVLYPSHTKVGARTIPTTAIYADALDPSSRTTATIRSPSLKPIGDEVFRKSFLERSR